MERILKKLFIEKHKNSKTEGYKGDRKRLPFEIKDI